MKGMKFSERRWVRWDWKWERASWGVWGTGRGGGGGIR